MTDTLPTKARAFAIQHHGEQRYGDEPYVFHLDAVADLVKPFGDQAVAVAYLHDVLEDTPATTCDIKREFGDFIAQCVLIITDEPGSTRKERKEKAYAKMADVAGKHELALLVKAADRLANLRACRINQNNSRLAMYQQEHTQFKQSAFRPGLCDEFWAEMNRWIDSPLHREQ